MLTVRNNYIYVEYRQHLHGILLVMDKQGELYLQFK